MDKYVLVPRELLELVVLSLDSFCKGEYPHSCDEDRLATLEELLDDED